VVSEDASVFDLGYRYLYTML